MVTIIAVAINHEVWIKYHSQKGLQMNEGLNCDVIEVDCMKGDHIELSTTKLLSLTSNHPFEDKFLKFKLSRGKTNRHLYK